MDNEQTIYRISSQHRTLYSVLNQACPEQEITATLAGKLSYQMEKPEDYPAVGDYVHVELQEGTARITRLLPRKNALVRKMAGSRSDAQIIAANVDLMLICASLNRDFNPRRLERYFSVAFEAGVTPLVVLTKADLAQQREEYLEQIQSLQAEAVLCSAATGEGVGLLRQRIHTGVTAALAGSSGVGKSTLINCLMGEERLRTSAVREKDSRGRHTTTGRQLIPLPGGGAVIDTPGMRELALMGDEADEVFSDIAALAENCRFRNCRHMAEPGCAVRAAVERGALTQERLRAWRKLRKG